MVLAIVRCDHEVNEVAVQHAVLGSVEPEMATSEELEKVGFNLWLLARVDDDYLIDLFWLKSLFYYV